MNELHATLTEESVTILILRIIIAYHMCYRLKVNNSSTRIINDMNDTQINIIKIFINDVDILNILRKYKDDSFIWSEGYDHVLAFNPNDLDLLLSSPWHYKNYIVHFLKTLNTQDLTNNSNLSELLLLASNLHTDTSTSTLSYAEVIEIYRRENDVLKSHLLQERPPIKPFVDDYHDSFDETHNQQLIRALKEDKSNLVQQVAQLQKMYSDTQDSMQQHIKNADKYCFFVKILSLVLICFLFIVIYQNYHVQCMRKEVVHQPKLVLKTK